MKTYNHITDYEQTLDTFNKKCQELDKILSFFENNQQDYYDLINYYYSDQREQDLKDDKNHLIPPDLKRGVLSQDGIYDLMFDYHHLNIRMLELGTNFFKNN